MLRNDCFVKFWLNIKNNDKCNFMQLFWSMCSEWLSATAMPILAQYLQNWLSNNLFV